MKGVISQPEWVQRVCPFCGKELGKVQTARRKISRICKCKNCGSVIDERMVVR